MKKIKLMRGKMVYVKVKETIWIWKNLEKFMERKLGAYVINYNNLIVGKKFYCVFKLSFVYLFIRFC